MSYQVEFEPEAIADLDRMASSIRERILRKINWFALNLDNLTPEALKGELASFFKPRVGDYRIIYDLDSTSQTIVIIRVGHRSEIYDL